MKFFELKMRLMALLVVLCCLIGAGSRVARAQSPPAWVQGDVVVAIGNNQYQVYHNNGTASMPNYVLVQTLNQGELPFSADTTGCAFDLASNLYTTSFENNDVVKFDANSPHSVLQTINTTGSTPVNSLDNESIVFASSGDFFVGHADGDHLVHRYNASGMFQQTYAVAVERRGSDWIELSTDQHTLFYTSEGRLVKRFDLSTSTQLPDFANLGALPGRLFALRLLPPGDGSGGLLVANLGDVKRLNSSGIVVQTYTAPGESFFFAMNLDPDGTSFWAGGFFSGKLYKFDIESGTILTSFPTGATGSFPAVLGGICVKGQAAAANTTTQTLGPPGTTIIYKYKNDSAKITPTDNSPTGGELVTVKAVLVPQSAFPTNFNVTNKTTGFTGIETCIPANDYSTSLGVDTCLEFQLTCTPTADTPTLNGQCNIHYTLALGFDQRPGTMITNPDLVVLHDGDCELKSADAPNLRSIFDAFLSLNDPTDVGCSLGPSCYAATHVPGSPPTTPVNSYAVGLFPPIGGPPTVNNVNANAAINILWQLFSASGPVTPTTSPSLTYCDPTTTTCGANTVTIQFFPMACGAPGSTSTSGVAASSAGSSGLQFNPPGTPDAPLNTWQFNAKPPGSFAGTCQELRVAFPTGTSQPGQVLRGLFSFF